MKRPFAVIGLTYLVTLSFLFHVRSSVASCIILCTAALASAAAAVLRLIRRECKLRREICAAAVSALCAVLAVFLFQTFAVQPVVRAYAGRSVRVEGYVDDDITCSGNHVTYTICAEAIDGVPCRVKICYTAFGGYDIEPFCTVSATMTPRQVTNAQNLSKGIYLCALEESGASLQMTGRRTESVFRAAFCLRRHMKHRLKLLLDSEASGLAGAVLLGDRQGLSADVRRAFSETGTTYLVVVSGMHLAVVTFMLRKPLYRLKRARAWLLYGFIVLFIVSFAAVTGFSPSVCRAGIMLIIVCRGRASMRTHDHFNSLGAAALLLTLPNPYAVGDIGMLLSFSSTLGILLRADPIFRFFTRGVLRERKPCPGRQPTPAERLGMAAVRVGRWFASFFATSLAALLWSLPVMLLLLGFVTPLSAVISLFAYPLTCAVLLAAFLLLLMVLLFPFAPAAGLPLIALIQTASGWLCGIIRGFAALPFCTVPVDKGLCCVWAAVTAALVAVGYLIHARRLYRFSAVVISVLTLTIGGSLGALLSDEDAAVTIYRSGSGYTAAVGRGSSLSLLSCGGTGEGEERVLRMLENAGQLDDILLSGSGERNAAYLPSILAQSAPEHLLFCGGARQAADGQPERHPNEGVTLLLNCGVRVQVREAGKQTLLLLRSARTSVLIAPPETDFTLLPREWRQADVLLTEGRQSVKGLVSCGRVISVCGEACENAERLADNAAVTIKLQ